MPDAVGDVSVKTMDAVVAPATAAAGTTTGPSAAALTEYRWLRHRRRTKPVASWSAIGLATDLVLVAAMLGVAGASSGVRAPWILLLGLVTSVVLLRHRPRVLRTTPAVMDDMLDGLVAVLIGTLVATGASTFFEPEPETAYALAQLGLMLALALEAGRLGVEIAHRRAIAQGRGRLQTLIVGDEAMGRVLGAFLLRSPTIGLNPIGILSELTVASIAGADDTRLPRLGGTSALTTVLRDRAVEHVVVVGNEDQDRLRKITDVCRAAGIDASVGTPSQIGLGRTRPAERLGGVTLLHLDRLGPQGWQLAIKYGIDRVLAAVLLIVALPLMLIIGALVAIDSGRPVFFRQRRVGERGVEFDVLKFRTMRDADPEEKAQQLEAARSSTVEVDLAPGGRGLLVTRIGAFLRRTSLDELPQLLNVARGEMSLIGPRPERPEFVNLFEEHVECYGDRHRVKPGMTGWAQVNGLRGQTSLRERVAYDNDYITYWSPWLDIKIAALTVPAMLIGKNAE
jgi:exopolysaccharide biosynthesis polyprenyl glycosylphosphotransferase